MVSFKGKCKVKDPLPGDRRSMKNELKIYSDNEKIDISARKFLDMSRKNERKPLMRTQELVSSTAVAKAANEKENAEKAKGKCDVSVKTKNGRKALANISNRSYPLRSQIDDGTKLNVQMKKSIRDVSGSSRKLAKGNAEAPDNQLVKDHPANNSEGTMEFKIYSDDGKISGQSHGSVAINDRKVSSKPPASTRRKSMACQRMYGGSSSIKPTNTLNTRATLKLGSAKTNIKNSQKVTTKQSISVGIRTRRRPLVEINNVKNPQPRSRPSDGSKITNQTGKAKLPPGKMQEGKFIPRPRFSLTAKRVMDANTSSRKPFVTSTRIAHTSCRGRTTLKSKPRLGLEKKVGSTTLNSSMNKEEKPAIKHILKDTAAAVSNECSLVKRPSDDNGCSSQGVTAIISRPNIRRRRSYTTSLVARRKDELPSIDDGTNQLEVAEYVDDIYQYYWVMEAQNPSLANHMSVQTEINPRMRGILINWLIEVHLKFELMQETLFLMVELFDRFISMVTIKKNDMQLVGLTALLLASKYEDFWHPKIKDLLSISVNAYTRDQMLAMEKLILKKLMFRLNAPTPYVFMLRFVKAAQSDSKLEHLAFYLIELCLVEYEALKFKPSLLCASAIYVARCTLNKIPAWTELLKKHTHYEESQLRTCGDMILRFQRAASQGQLRVTYEKYLSSDRSCVAEIQAIDKLPL